MTKRFTAKNKFGRILIILIGIVVCLLMLMGYVPNANDFYSRSFASQLSDCPVPEGCAVMEKHELLGKLNGNGNGMDFAAIVLLQTDLEITAEDLIDYYSSFSFYPAKRKGHAVELVVEPIERAFFTHAHIRNRSIYFQSTFNLDEHHYYAVILYDGGYSSGLDIRGN